MEIEDIEEALKEALESLRKTYGGKTTNERSGGTEPEGDLHGGTQTEDERDAGKRE